MTRNITKKDTFHVISALWHGFPIVLTDFGVSKCVTVIFHVLYEGQA